MVLDEVGGGFGGGRGRVRACGVVVLWKNCVIVLCDGRLCWGAVFLGAFSLGPFFPFLFLMLVWNLFI